MATTNNSTSQNTPRGILSGMFGPKFLDDPEAIHGIASSLGIGPGAPATPSGSPSPSGDPGGPIAAPMAGVVPKSFGEWASDPVNTGKVVPQANGTPMPGMNPNPAPSPVASPVDSAQPTIAPAMQPSNGMSPASLSPEPFPGFKDWIAKPENAAKAAIPLAPHQYGTRGSIAMALATLGDHLGSVYTGDAPTVGNNWLKQIAAGQEYQRQLPVTTQTAQTTAYEQAQEQAGKSASIAGTQAQTAHLEAETKNLQNGSMYYKQVGDARQHLIDLWKGGTLSEKDFDREAKSFKQGLDPRVASLMDQSGDFLQQVKALPQTPPKFTAGANGIEPITYRGQNYGVTPVQGEPAEIAQARQTALDAQKQNELSKQDLKAGEFPPVVTGLLGKPPLNDPKAMQSYSEKAKKIMIDISSAPRVNMIDARPVPVAEVDKDGKPTGRIIYQRTGEAIKSDAMAPGSIPFQADKKVTISATSGPIGDKITAFNTAIAHADLLRQAAKAMNNGDSRTLNSLKNRLSSEFGDPDLTNLEAISNAYNHEVTSVISKGHMTDKEVSTGNATMPSNANYETIDKVLNSYQGLMKSKMDNLQQQVEKGQKGEVNFPSSGGTETKYYKGAAYTKGADGQWHKSSK